MESTIKTHKLCVLGRFRCICAVAIGCRGRGVAPEPLNKCAEGAFQVANGRRSRHETQRSCGDPPKRSEGVMYLL